MLPHVDALSRLPEKECNDVVKMHLIDVTAKFDFPLSAGEIALATKADPVLSKVMTAVSGHWRMSFRDVDFRPFKQNLSSLSIQQDCLLLANRVIIPSALRARVLFAARRSS